MGGTGLDGGGTSPSWGGGPPHPPHVWQPWGEKIFFFLATFVKLEKLSAKCSLNDAIISHENTFLTENVPILVVYENYEE